MEKKKKDGRFTVIIVLLVLTIMLQGVFLWKVWSVEQQVKKTTERVMDKVEEGAKELKGAVRWVKAQGGKINLFNKFKDLTDEDDE